MKTSNMLVLSLLGAAAVVAGCATTAPDDVDSTDLAQVAKRAEDDDDELVVQDRMGRPEMTNVTIGAGLVRLKLAKGGEQQALAGQLKAEDPELVAGLAKDAADAAAEAARVAAGGKPGQRRPSAYFRAYNHQQTFHPKDTERADAKRMLAAGIRALDRLSLDGQSPDPEDWTEAEVLRMAEILEEDALIVNLDGKGDCMKSTVSYFGFERDAFRGVAENPSNCGGRTLDDDIIDDTLTMWVTKTFDFGEAAPRRVRDHVVPVKKAETVAVPELGGSFQLSPALDRFPYLGEPREKAFRGLGTCSVKCRSEAPAASSSAATPPPGNAQE